MNAEFPAAIAPEIDRVRIEIAGRMRERMADFADTGVTPPTMGTFAMLRNLPPARRASRAGIDEVFVYQPRDATAAAFAELERVGLITPGADDIGLTDAGSALVDRLLRVANDVVDQLWSDSKLDFAHLRAITDTALRAAAKDGGLAFAVMAPAYQPPWQTPACAFAEALTPLRFHRFDAHIAAWRAAGLSVEQARALAGGDQEKAIEAETNRRAATPYLALRDSDRDELLAALRSLPG